MSEMTPVARVDGRWSDGRAMIRTLEAGANMPLSTELYTSEQLAEAVAAEGGRILKEVEARVDTAIPGNGIDIAFGDLCEILEAIRSAAK